MRARLKQIPLLKMTVADPEFMQGSPTQAPLSVYLRGDDMAELQRLNEEVVAKVKAVPGAVDVDSTLETGQPEMAASVNRELAPISASMSGSVAMQLRGMVRRHRADAPARGRQGVRHPRAARAGVPQRLRVDLADAALLARPARWCAPATSCVRARSRVRRRSIAKQRRRQAKIDIELSDRPLGDVTADCRKVMAGVAMPRTSSGASPATSR
jgi:HAE1 family hydrophobic/amphiphilic exporter-1